jgi:hypothetical protein
VDVAEMLFPAAQSDGPLASAVVKAQQNLAEYLGVDVGASLVVKSQANEATRGYDIVLRHEDRMYLYRARANGSVVLVEIDYTFADGPDTGVWHDIDRPRFAPPAPLAQPPASLPTARRGLAI